jgi:hypothetical protein
MEVMKHFVMAIKGISTKQNISEDLKKQLKINEVVVEASKHAQKSQVTNLKQYKKNSSKESCN